MSKNPEVYIDGVKYVPIQEVLVNLDFFVDKLIESWYGKGWNRNKKEELLNDLKIVITDDARGGTSIKKFINDMVE